MAIEDDLRALVKKYENQTINHELLLKLDVDFARLINKELLLKGPEKAKIDKQYRKLLLLFHPDRMSTALPEIQWIEAQLSQGKNAGLCFKILHTNHNQLTEPKKINQVNFNDIKNAADCRCWLEQLKSNAKTYSGRSLCTSLIDLLDQSVGFLDETGKIKPQGIRVLISCIPVIFAGFSAVLMAEELFAAYTLYFMLLKGGQYLGRSDSMELRSLGATLQELTVITATTTTTLIVRLLEMTFWASRQFYSTALEIGSTIFNPLISETPHQPETYSNANLCSDLILASQNLSPGIQYKTPEMKLISAPVEEYKKLNKQQYFGFVRLGGKKKQLVSSFLAELQKIDVCPISLADKLIAVEKELSKVKNDRQAYASETKKAVDRADNIITLLKDMGTMEMVVYQPTGTPGQ